MPNTTEFWRTIINDFNPVGPALGEDVRRFFVDRSDDPTRSLVQRLKVSFQNSIGQPKPYKALLTGHVGSGKSTELRRLGEELAEDFFVVWFDAGSSLDETSANQFDILLAMGLAVQQEAMRADLNPPARLAKDLTKSLTKFVRKYQERKGFSLNPADLMKQIASTTIVAGAAALGGPVAAGVAWVATSVASRLELNVSDDLVRTLELPPNRMELIGALNAIIGFAQRQCTRPLLIITDGLDKFSAAKAKALFADSALLTEPACALIYSAPIEFYHRIMAGRATNLFDEYKTLPNPPVSHCPHVGDSWHADRQSNEDGLRVMRRVVARRVEARGTILGQVITDDALNLLARMSGGVMREMVRFIRETATSAQQREATTIDLSTAQDAVNQQRQEIAPRLTINHREAVKRVLQQGALSGGQHEAVEDDLLRTLHLLSYQDGVNFWFDAHPNVLPLL